MTGKYSQKPGTWNTEKYGEYSGATNWQEYCSFINDVLRNIRAGQIDYVVLIVMGLDIIKRDVQSMNQHKAVTCVASVMSE